MKNSTLKWHLARDNQKKLFRFCETNKQSITWNDPKDLGYTTNNALVATFTFDNNGYIIVEMLKEVSCTDHFQVIDYGWGNK